MSQEIRFDKYTTGDCEYDIHMQLPDTQELTAEEYASVMSHIQGLKSILDPKIDAETKRIADAKAAKIAEAAQQNSTQTQQQS